MTEREKALEGLDLMIGFCDTMTKVCHDGDKITYEEHLKLLKIAKKALEQVDYDADIVWKCRLGQIKKYVGRGVVILNYDWWIEQLGRKKDFQPVPDWEEVVELAEPAGWISVEDRLPEGRGEIYAEGLEDSATVLVACTTPDGRREYGLATYIRDHELAGDDGWNGIIDEIEEIGPKTKVTHWMPLPELPEGGGKE